MDKVHLAFHAGHSVQQHIANQKLDALLALQQADREQKSFQDALINEVLMFENAFQLDRKALAENPAWAVWDSLSFNYWIERHGISIASFTQLVAKERFMNCQNSAAALLTEAQAHLSNEDFFVIANGKLSENRYLDALNISIWRRIREEMEKGPMGISIPSFLWSGPLGWIFRRASGRPSKKHTLWFLWNGLPSWLNLFLTMSLALTLFFPSMIVIAMVCAVLNSVFGDFIKPESLFGFLALIFPLAFIVSIYLAFKRKSVAARLNNLAAITGGFATSRVTVAAVRNLIASYESRFSREALQSAGTSSKEALEFASAMYQHALATARQYGINIELPPFPNTTLLLSDRTV